MSEMGAQPSRASCLPGTKTDRRNLCEPRRYERRLPISEYHDLTLSRFSRYVASLVGAREERYGGRPAQPGSLCPKWQSRACPVWGHEAGSESAFLQISHSLARQPGGAGANIAGNQCGDGAGGPGRISGPAIGPAPAGPHPLAQFSRSARNVKMVSGGTWRPIPFLQHLDCGHDDAQSWSDRSLPGARDFYAVFKTPSAGDKFES